MKKTLIIQLARFGDLIQTKRLARSLCRNSETHLCVDQSLEALARLVFPASEGFIVHPVAAHGQFSPAAALQANARAFADLAAQGFDEVYNLNSSAMNAALAAMFEPSTVRGLRADCGQPLHERWMQMAFRWTQERRLAPLNLADYWALFAPDPIAPGEVNPPAQGGGKGLGVVLAGRMARRSLPPQVLAPIVRVLAANLEGHKNAPIYLLGSATERPLAREVARSLPSGLDIHDLTGTTDWPGLVDALTDLDAVISPDTGSMHLAAYLGVPVRAFFLSSAWAWETGPYGLGHSVFQAVRHCLPCVETQKCPYQTACLEPFRSTDFLRWLAKGGQGAGVEGILHLRAEQDALGQHWAIAPESGPMDSAAASRAALRALVAEYAGLRQSADSADFINFAVPGDSGGANFTAPDKSPAGPDALSAELLFQERDWMLPPLAGTPALGTFWPGSRAHEKSPPPAKENS